MSLTPYEIRLELLKMAKSMLEQDYHNKCDKIRNEWNTEVGFAMDGKKDIPVHPAFPSFPSEQEIVDKAKLLNSFVSQTS